MRPALAGLLLIVGAACGGAGPGLPPPPPAGRDVAGEVVRVEGSAEIGRPGDVRRAAVGDSVHAGDAIRTGDGEVDVRLGDSLAVRVKPRSTVILVRNDVGDGGLHATEVRLEAGTVLQRIDRRPGTTDYRVMTPVAGAAVRGTWFAAEAAGGSMKVSVAKGAVVVANDAGGREVGEGEGTEASAGARPASPRRLLDAEFEALRREIGSLRFYAEAIRFTRQTVGVAEASNIELTLETHRAMNGRYPATLAEAGWRATDPWGNPYVYTVAPDGQSYTLGSHGPDGRPGTEDDVTYR